MVRTPLDELVLQVCLLYEQRRDQAQAQGKSLGSGVDPCKFLGKALDPPPNNSLVNACEHLLEADALSPDVNSPSPALYRLTPLGYHLVRFGLLSDVYIHACFASKNNNC